MDRETQDQLRLVLASLRSNEGLRGSWEEAVQKLSKAERKKLAEFL